MTRYSCAPQATDGCLDHFVSRCPAWPTALPSITLILWGPVESAFLRSQIGATKRTGNLLIARYDLVSLEMPYVHRNPNEFPQPTLMATIQPIAGENEQHPDVALVERVRGGDVSAYDTLVRKYDRQIFRIAQHITQNREDAEDVMQDAFLKAYEKLDQFQGNSKFYTWLVRIAVNESLMRLRKRRTGKMVSIDEDVETEEGSVPRDLADWAPDPEQNYTQAELAEILRKTIQGLPQGFRVVFVLRDVEGLSTEETAETLGLSVPAVKSRLLRARLQLRERLSRYFRREKGS